MAWVECGDSLVSCGPTGRAVILSLSGVRTSSAALFLVSHIPPLAVLVFSSEMSSQKGLQRSNSVEIIAVVQPGSSKVAAAGQSARNLTANRSLPANASSSHGDVLRCPICTDSLQEVRSIYGTKTLLYLYHLIYTDFTRLQPYHCYYEVWPRLLPKMPWRSSQDISWIFFILCASSRLFISSILYIFFAVSILSYIFFLATFHGPRFTTIRVPIFSFQSSLLPATILSSLSQNCRQTWNNSPPLVVPRSSYCRPLT